MSNSLVELENRRANVQARIAQLGDMRAGSITATGGIVGTRAVIAIRTVTQVTVPTTG